MSKFYKVSIFLFFILVGFLLLQVPFEYQKNKLKLLIDDANQIDYREWDKPYADMQLKPRYKFVILTTKGGEWAQAQHQKKAAESLGWEAKIFYRSMQGHETEFLEFDPDFMIYTLNTNKDFSQEITSHRSKKIAQFFYPIINQNAYIGNWIHNDDLEKISNLNLIFSAADAFLITDTKIKIVADYYKKNNRQFYAINCIPNTIKTNYSPAEMNHLTLAGNLYDPFKNGAEFKKTLSLLHQEKILKAYGTKDSYEFILNSYQGHINSSEDLLKTLNKNGITLVVHGEWHRVSGIPSARIAEAAAANTLIISDRQPFVVQHYGDNVLYFDTDIDGDKMFEQIMNHYKWAKANPKQAKEMANRAHQIFLDKFTTEKDLIRIAKMYEKMLEDDKNRKTEFPATYSHLRY